MLSHRAPIPQQVFQAVCVRMGTKPEIGAKILGRGFSQHSAGSFRPEYGCVRQKDVAEETDALPPRPNLDFARVEFSLEPCTQDDICRVGQGHCFSARRCEHDKIIAVTDVMPNMEFVFHRQIELVQIDVCEQLACKVAERNAFPRRHGKTFNDAPQKLHRVPVIDVPSE